MTPVGRFVRARLHRRIFLGFGASILLLVVFAGLLAALISWTAGPWYTRQHRRELDRARALTSRLFGDVWDAPAERDTLARSVASDLNLTIKLMDPDARLLASYGPPCHVMLMTAPVVREGQTLGLVSACLSADYTRPRFPFWFITPLAVIGGVLWAASGAIARRIAKPLSEVARVAQEIGEGNLSARVRLRGRSHDEVGVVADAINEMASRIERQMADQRELLAAVSHELRTPLARMRLLTELTRGGGASDSALDEIDREVMEIDALVGDLLASSRIDFSALTKRRLSAHEAARRAIERAGLPPDLLSAEGSELFVDADATLLARALANLIDNAKKHGGGVSRVIVRATESRVVFEVEDAGPGLVPGEADRIFEPFYRRDQGEREGGSLGLGLALVKRIAEAHDGEARAENREGGGARVGIALPLAAPAPAS